jgi:hypothetical protein
MDDHDEIALSRVLAGIIGPTLMVMTATETPNLHIWNEKLPTVTYLDGMVLFIAGMVVVRLHNRWMRRWPVAVTAAGWLLLAAGAARMAFPEADQLPEGSPATYAVIAALFGLGGFLTFNAYRPLRP